MTTTTDEPKVQCSPDLILVDLDVDTAEEAIRALSRRLEHAGIVRSTFAESVISREKTYPTGLPTAVPVAIPHTDPEHCLRTGIAVGLLRNPVAFGAMGSQGQVHARIVFLLAITKPHSQVAWLGRLVHFFQEPGLLQELEGAKTPQQVVGILNERLFARAVSV